MRRLAAGVHIGAWLRALGVRPTPPKNVLRLTLRVLAQYREFRALQVQSQDSMPVELSHPCLDDYHAEGGTARGHYFHQDLLVARRVFTNRPERHMDVGSRVDGFVAHVASFRRIEVIDVRPTLVKVPNIEFLEGDITALDPKLIGSCDSLSCLHALEHVGLGRYGDRLDPAGSEKALAGLADLLKPGGTLYLSVPVGRERIEFNAHRVFSLPRIEAMLAKYFKVQRFAWVDGRGALHDLGASEIPRAQIATEEFALGIFEATRMGTAEHRGERGENGHR
jgi:SAM-dependent methyltransferase